MKKKIFLVLVLVAGSNFFASNFILKKEPVKTKIPKKNDTLQDIGQCLGDVLKETINRSKVSADIQEILVNNLEDLVEQRKGSFFEQSDAETLYGYGTKLHQMLDDLKTQNAILADYKQQLADDFCVAKK